jgi:hypothetical protein
MRRALGLAGLVLTGILPAPAAHVPPPNPPHCATTVIRSIVGTYCEPALWTRDSPIV